LQLNDYNETIMTEYSALLQKNKMLLEIQIKDETLYVRDKIVF